MYILIETAYLPPVSYMAEILHSDAAVIEIFETYQKQTYRNHCAIYGPNGKQILSIPVVKVNGNHTLTKDVRISDHQPWQKIHWRSIETAYNNSPFFLFYQDLFAPFYQRKFNFLADLNMELLQVIIRIMKVERNIGPTSCYEKFPPGIRNLRGSVIQAKSHGEFKIQEGIIQQKTEVTSGLNENHPENKCVHFSDYPKYTQVFEPRHGFIAGLSVIDVIFNLGPETTDYLRNCRMGHIRQP